VVEIPGREQVKMDRWEKLLRRCEGKEKDDDVFLLVFDPEIAVENEDGTFRPMMKFSDQCEEIHIW
jgi:hypothetical protein